MNDRAQTILPQMDKLYQRVPLVFVIKTYVNNNNKLFKKNIYL